MVETTLDDDEIRRRRREAVELSDKIRVPAPPGFDSTKLIREWRDRRYGPKHRSR